MMNKPITRRDFLRFAALVSTGAAVTACAPTYNSLAGVVENAQGTSRGDFLETALPENQYLFHMLNRFTYGPTLDERQSVAQQGIHAWIEEQLASETIDDTACELRLRQFTTLNLSANDLFDLSDRLFDEQDRQRVPGELRQATLLRQIYSRRQLYESMVEFWSDHFNISVDKGECFYLKTVDDRSVVRPNAMGSFSNLLRASAHSPAMLVYLDNQANHQGAPNENYARELLELHSLGVNGGYDQTDVISLARCLTGWSVKEHFWRGDFVFRESDHDPTSKIFMGVPVNAHGQDEVEAIIDRLAAHESTAKHIAWKLVRRFIADNPPDELVIHGMRAFEKSHGDLRQVLRSILLDGIRYLQPKYKRPVHFMVSALRILNARVDRADTLMEHLSRMGQLYFAWPTPDGYPDYSEAWQGNLLPRWQFTADLTQDNLPGVHFDANTLFNPDWIPEPIAILERLSRLLLGGSLSVESRRNLQEVITANPWHATDTVSLAAAVLLASPDFQWH